jgi:hypothetical protein
LRAAANEPAQTVPVRALALGLRKACFERTDRGQIGEVVNAADDLAVVVPEDAGASNDASDRSVLAGDVAFLRIDRSEVEERAARCRSAVALFARASVGAVT